MECEKNRTWFCVVSMFASRNRWQTPSFLNQIRDGFDMKTLFVNFKATICYHNMENLGTLRYLIIFQIG